MKSFQELADEAFRDLLHKYGRPTDLKAALRESARPRQRPSGPYDASTLHRVHLVCCSLRYRTCHGSSQKKTWMAGTSPAMTLSYPPLLVRHLRSFVHTRGRPQCSSPCGSSPSRTRPAAQAANHATAAPTIAADPAKKARMTALLRSREMSSLARATTSSTRRCASPPSMPATAAVRRIR